MSAAVEHRSARLLIPGVEPGHLWVDAAGALPRHDFDVEAGSSTVATLQREVLPAFGISGPILDCSLRYDRPWRPETVVSALVALEPQPPAWRAPVGWTSVAISAADLTVFAPLQPLVAQWVGEQRGELEPDPLAPEWTRRGWFARARDWIESAAGESVVVEHHRAWGISIVLVATGAERRYWFKGVCKHFGAEVAVTEVLAEIAAAHVPPLLAVDRDERWLLLADLGDVADADETSHRSAYATLRRLQRDVAGHHDELVAAGAEVRPFDTLAARVADVLGDPALHRWHATTPGRAAEVVAWLSPAIAEVGSLGLPDVLVHGDFHPGNVAEVGDRRVIFDWSDAALAPPFIDVVTWLTWIEDDADERTAVWQSFADEWSDVLSAEQWLAHRRLLEGVAAAYHVVSYAGIVRGLDPLHAEEHGDGIREFFALLDAAVPR